MKKEEYNIITKTTYYAFWKLNKCWRILKNEFIQEIKRISCKLGFHKWVKNWYETSGLGFLSYHIVCERCGEFKGRNK